MSRARQGLWRAPRRALTISKVQRWSSNLGLMMKAIGRTSDVPLCRTCMHARGIADAELVEGARRSTLDARAAHTLTAQRALEG